MYTIRQILFAYAFCRRLEFREQKRKHIFISILVLFLFSILTQWVIYSGDLNQRFSLGPFLTIVSTVIWCSINFLILFLVLRYIFRISKEEAVYATTLSYMLEHMDYCLMMLIKLSVPETLKTTFDNYWFEIIRLVLIAGLFDFFFTKRMIHEKHYIAQTMETVSLLFVVLILVELLSAFATEYGFVGIHAVYAIIMGFFIMGSQLERQNALVLQKEMSIKEQLLISQHLQYEVYKENVELVNRKCHDLKHQVEALRLMDSESEKKKTLREIEEAVLIYDSFIKTGCDMLDTILTQKNHLCLEEDILFTCVADGSCLSKMNPVDLYTLFGNLMDNAIEAVKKLPKEQRSISLFIGREKGLIVINEENTYAKVVKKNNRFISTKVDKANHGFGLKSMALVVDKYDGCMNSINDDEKFKISIVIPQEYNDYMTI